jgi:acyl carrier protein
MSHLTDWNATDWEKIVAIVADQMGLAEDQIDREQSLYTYYGADSADMTEIVMAIEEECDIDIPDQELGKINTLGDLEIIVKGGGRFPK